MFEYYKPNQLLDTYKRGKHKGEVKHAWDCVVRAFSKAWGLSWTETAKNLFDYALAIQRIPDEEEVWRHNLFESGKKPYVIRDGKKRYLTVREVAKSTEFDNEKYILNCRNHLVCVGEGKYYDCWDSGDIAVRGIYRVKSCPSPHQRSYIV